MWSLFFCRVPLRLPDLRLALGLIIHRQRPATQTLPAVDDLTEQLCGTLRVIQRGVRLRAIERNASRNTGL